MMGGAASTHKEACVSIMRVSFADEMIYPEKRRRLEVPCSTRALADGKLLTKGVQNSVWFRGIWIKSNDQFTRNYLAGKRF